MNNGQEVITATIFCNECGKVTTHRCHGAHSSYRGDYEFYGYRLYICDECEAGALEEFYTTPEICDERGGNWNKEDLVGEYAYFPERLQFIRQPREFPRIPQKLNGIYHEIIIAFNAHLPILCAIGIRALIEGICIDNQITDWGLKDKIPKLDDLVDQEIVDGLNTIKGLGDAAAHRLDEAFKEEAELAIEFCEELLAHLYCSELTQKSKDLKKVYDAKNADPRLRLLALFGKGWS